MNTAQKFLILSSLFFVLGLFFAAQKTYAQFESLGLATYLQIAEKKIENGHIISTSNKGYIFSRTPYDQAFIGVVNTDPAISIRRVDQKQGFPVVKIGEIQAKVTNTNGDIKKGDYITTSETPGVGVKAEQSGYVIGQALEDVKFGKKGEVKLAQVVLNPHHAQVNSTINNSLFDIFKLSSLAAYEKPSRVLQYVVATLIILISFGAGFLIFAKAVNTGMEALGRNPLAGRMIQLSLIFNVLMIVVIVVLGTGLAYIVLRL